MASSSTPLDNQVFAVTGSSQGLGLAIARALVAAGGKVALLARNQTALAEVEAELGENSKAFPTDITDPAAVEQAFAAIAEHFGRLDGLVNNAGLARPNKICDVTAEELSLQLNTNIGGVIFCSQAALPLLRQSGNARIINISSASARSRFEISMLGIYSASKAAVERLSDEMRDEFREDGIAVTVLSPGATMTDFASGWEEEKLIAATRAWLKKGAEYDGYMDMKYVGQAVADCFNYPKGVCIDFVEIRPNAIEQKPAF